MTLDELLSQAPYGQAQPEKLAMLVPYFRELTEFHRRNCPEYSRILLALGRSPAGIETLEDVPFLPVRLFKDYDLRSVNADRITKTMTSSGTTGQAVSRIHLDAEAATVQSKTLAKILTGMLGSPRQPMLVLDSEATASNRNYFSARTAGIRGFSMFARNRAFALTATMDLDRDEIDRFLDAHGSRPFLLFGFTFVVWRHFCEVLSSSGYRPDMRNGLLIHGGGWKKLADLAVSTTRFKQSLEESCGLRPDHIRDYYGMVEQTGSIHLECERGNLHSSMFSEVMIRRATDFGSASVGEPGVIQCLSVLPRSYPGHSLLTEDEGVLLGVDDCPCGRMGKYFQVFGRLKNAEIRGCSNTYAG